MNFRIHKTYEFVLPNSTLEGLVIHHMKQTNQLLVGNVIQISSDGEVTKHEGMKVGLQGDVFHLKHRIKSFFHKNKDLFEDEYPRLSLSTVLARAAEDAEGEFEGLKKIEYQLKIPYKEPDGYYAKIGNKLHNIVSFRYKPTFSKSVLDRFDEWVFEDGIDYHFEFSPNEYFNHESDFTYDSYVQDEELGNAYDFLTEVGDQTVFVRLLKNEDRVFIYNIPDDENEEDPYEGPDFNIEVEEAPPPVVAQFFCNMRFTKGNPYTMNLKDGQILTGIFTGENKKGEQRTEFGFRGIDCEIVVRNFKDDDLLSVPLVQVNKSEPIALSSVIEDVSVRHRIIQDERRIYHRKQLVKDIYHERETGLAQRKLNLINRDSLVPFSAADAAGMTPSTQQQFGLDGRSMRLLQRNTRGNPQLPPEILERIAKFLGGKKTRILKNRKHTRKRI